MVDKREEGEVGGFFSRTYLRVAGPLSDDGRARHRMAAYLSEYYSDKQYEIGKFIEQELGIKCLRAGTSRYYIDWQVFLRDLEIRDFLDVITAAIRFEPRRKAYKDRVIVISDLLEFARRVFSEQNLAYRIDEKGGVHPFIDAAFSISLAGLIRNLANSELEAAREHIAIAERSLLAGSFDGRQAIRSTFDAAENLLKVIFERATQLNTQTINEKLGPFLLDASSKNKTERQAAEKLVKSLIDWVEAAHFYRHASGGTEVVQPSEQFTISFVSLGFSFVRWIADSYASKDLLGSSPPG